MNEHVLISKYHANALQIYGYLLVHTNPEQSLNPYTASI